MMSESQPYGVMIEFEDAGALVRAVRQSREAGFAPADAFAPYPVPGLPEALGFRDNRVPRIAFGAGIIGGALAFLLQWYSAVLDYPYVVGGKPLASWPAFLPITFEAGILAAVISSVLAMLALNRLPQPYHPVFNEPAFEKASGDRFFLLFTGVNGSDRHAIEELMSRLDAVATREVAS